MLSLFLAPVLAGLTPSQAAFTAFQMACSKGELKLDPSEAKITRTHRRSWSWPLSEWGDPTSVTKIDLTYPNDTTIDIATYDARLPQQIATA
ncbi:hypothetical protein, partial [Sphingomonas sp.]|uniref:hypothetical protein n=1 Tax=Sphingomonas sp. TaxID=28214 RepID=UPI0025F6F347